MSFGHFTWLWRCAYRQVGVLSQHPTKSFGRFVSNGGFQRVSSSGMVCESHSARRACADSPNFSKQNMGGIWPGDRVGLRPVLLHCGSNLRSRLSSDNLFSGWEKRWIHFEAFDDDLRRSLEKASSWSAFLSLEKAMRRQSDGKVYEKFVEACERRLAVLYREGVLSVDDLPFVVRQECGEWQALFLAVGCASRLASANFGGGFSLDKMAKFLYAVNTHRGHERAGCERLQPMVAVFEDNMRNVPSKCILNALSSTAHIKSKGLSLYEVMVGVERLYGKKLGELTAQELVWFAAASGRISGKEKQYDCRALHDNLLEEYSCRQSEFSPHQCIQMLISMAFSMPSGPLCNERILFDTENCVAPALSSQSLSSKEVAQLSAIFSHFAYTAKKISFRDLLYTQIGLFNGHHVGQVFHYVSKSEVVDQALLERLYPWIRQHLKGIHQGDICALLGALSLPGVRDLPGSRDCAFLLEEDIVRRMSFNPRVFSPVQCAHLMYALSRLRIVDSPAFDVLFKSSIGDFGQLPVLAMTQFVYGVSQLKKKDKYVAILCNAMRRTDIESKQLQLSGAVLVCKGLVGLRYVDELWLEKVVRFCGEHLSVLMLKDLKGMSIILFSLSYLDYDCPGLFRDVETWLLEHGALVSKVGWSTEIIQILWASVVQGVHPITTFKQLSKCAAPIFEEMLEENVLSLHELSVILRYENEMDILPPDAHAALCQFVKGNHPVIPGNVRDCIQSIVRCFSSGHVRSDVLTAESLCIDCALLQSEEDMFVEWPAGVSVGLSMAEMDTLYRSGYQPLAVLVLGQAWYDLSQRMLGPLVMKSKALSACDWNVRVISVSEYEMAADKKSFLHSELGKDMRN